MGGPISPTRSRNMARIRGRDTRPEIALRRALWRLGLRYRLNYRILGVRPDVVFVSAKIVVFVDGCFWHGCPIHYTRPRSTSAKFWEHKLQENVARDQLQTNILTTAGWTVLRLWEHAVESDPDGTAESVARVVNGSEAPSPGRWAVFKVVEASDDPSIELWHIEHSSSGERRVFERSRPPKKAETT